MPHATMVALAGWLHVMWSSSVRLLSTSTSTSATHKVSGTNKNKNKGNYKNNNEYSSLYLSRETYGWIKDICEEHSACSVHKAIRDLFTYAVTECGSDEDLDFLFKACSHHRRRRSLDTPSDNYTEVPIRLNAKTQRWIADCIRKYHLKDISQLFTILTHVVIDLDAVKDVFASVETAAVPEPRKSADLYYDLGILPKPR